MLLTTKDIAELTGAKTKQSQKKILKEHGIGFIEAADGWPKTTWEAVNAVLAGKNKASFTPDFDLLDKI